MKILISKSRLQEALKRVGGVADGRSGLPILANVKLETGDGLLSLTTTNLDLTLCTAAECTVTEAGATTVPMKKFEQIVSVLPSDDVTITSDNSERVIITAGETRMTVSGRRVKDFPELPGVDAAAVCTIPCKDFSNVLKWSAYAMSRDETRKTLCSVLLELFNGFLTAVATDGRRLGKGVCASKNAAKGKTQFILPALAVAALQRSLDAEGDITVKSAGSQLVFEHHEGRDVIYSKLIDGAYPCYEQVIPADADADAVVDREALLALLGRMMVMASASAPSVTLSFSEGVLAVDAVGDSADEGDAHEIMPIKYSGAQFTTRFNPKYLMDVLKASTSDALHMNTESTGSKLIKITSDTEDLLSIIMPLRTV